MTALTDARGITLLLDCLELDDDDTVQHARERDLIPDDAPEARTTCGDGYMLDDVLAFLQGPVVDWRYDAQHSDARGISISF